MTQWYKLATAMLLAWRGWMWITWKEREESNGTAWFYLEQPRTPCACRPSQKLAAAASVISDYSLSYKQHMSDTSMLGDANCRGTRQLKEKRNKIAEAPQNRRTIDGKKNAAYSSSSCILGHGRPLDSYVGQIRPVSLGSKSVGFVPGLRRFLLLLQIMAEGRVQGLRKNKWSVLFAAVPKGEHFHSDL